MTQPFDLSYLHQLFIDSNIFDANWYANIIGMPHLSRNALVEHYIQSGAKNRLSPNSIFIPEFYISEVFTRLNIAISEEDAFFHFCSLKKGGCVSCHPCFDIQYYLHSNPDIAAAGVHPIQHYLDYGGFEGRYISPAWFDDRLDTLPPPRQNDAPLVHYTKLSNHQVPISRNQLYEQHFLFSSEYYRSSFVGSDPDITPIEHYLHMGDGLGYRPHPIFDTELYRKRGFKDSAKNPLEHFLSCPDRPNMPLPTDLVDPEYYTAQSGDLSHCNLDPLTHYCIIGWREGLNPHPLFNTEHYLQQINEDLGGYNDPLSHYLLCGISKNLDPNPYFSTKYYIQSHPHSFSPKTNPLSDYCSLEPGSPRTTSQTFNPERYLFDLSQEKQLLPTRESLLQHFLEFGLPNGFVPQPTLEKYHFDEPVESLINKLRELDATTHSNTGDVSVIITHDGSDENLVACLLSLLEGGHHIIREILVVEHIQSISLSTHIEHPEGFIQNINTKSSNATKTDPLNVAVNMARGDYVFSIDSAHFIDSECLKEIKDTFNIVQESGVVCTLVLDPKGIPQPCTGKVHSDGELKVQSSPLSLMSDIDFCVSSSFMFPKKIWDTLDGFDKIYNTHLYHIADLIFKIKAKGYKAIIQPSAIVYQNKHRILTDHPSPNFLKADKERFRNKWLDSKHILSKLCIPWLTMPTAITQPNALVIDVKVPTPDQDAGSVQTLHRLKFLARNGYNVFFIPTHMETSARYTNELAKHGIRVKNHLSRRQILEFLESMKDSFELVILSRVNEGGRFAKDVKILCPSAKLVFDLADLHYLRQMREASLLSDPREKEEALNEAMITKRNELEIIRTCDRTIILSEAEFTEITQEIPGFAHTLLPLATDVPGRCGSYFDRRDIIFIGGFSHRPNVDAVLHFVLNVWPTIIASIPACKLHVVGSNPPEEITALKSSSIKIHGFVQNLDKLMNLARVAIAPLRFGAGVKGKIGSYMGYGVPAVLSPVASEGMGLTHNVHALFAKDDDEFAEHVISLYSSPNKWQRISNAALEFAEQHFSFAAADEEFRKLLTDLYATSLDPKSSHRRTQLPTQSRYAVYQKEKSVVDFSQDLLAIAATFGWRFCYFSPLKLPGLYHLTPIERNSFGIIKYTLISLIRKVFSQTRNSVQYGLLELGTNDTSAFINALRTSNETRNVLLLVCLERGKNDGSMMKNHLATLINDMETMFEHVIVSANFTSPSYRIICARGRTLNSTR